MINDRGTVQRSRVPLYALFGARAISMMGNQLTAIAIPWFVLQTTGSASKTGITAVVTVLPSILSPFFGSGIVDRLSYKRTGVLTDVASGFIVALIPMLYLLHLLQLWQLLALVCLKAVLTPLGGTARFSMMPDLAQIAGMPLERANAVVQAITHGTILLGPPLAGLLIAVIGTANVLWMDAASFIISAAMIALAIPTLAKAREERQDPREGVQRGYMAELTAGLRFTIHDRVIRALILSALLVNFLTEPVISVILPVYTKRILDSSIAFGVTVAAMGGGALVGTIVYGSIGHKLPRRATFIGAFAGLALPFIVLAALLPFIVILAAFVVGGIASGPLNPLMAAVLQERVPTHMRARVFGVLSAGASAATPLGLLLAGYALGWSIRLTLVIAAAGLVVFIISLFFNRGLRDMERPAETAGEPSEQSQPA